MLLQALIKEGWNWAVGYSKDRGYFAEAWRDLPKPVWRDGNWIYRECKIKIAKSISEAEAALMKRIKQ